MNESKIVEIRCWRWPEREGEAPVTLILEGDKTSALVRVDADTHEVRVVRGWLPEQVEAGLQELQVRHGAK